MANYTLADKDDESVLAIALGHNSVTFEVTLVEMHGSSYIRSYIPDQPCRIAMVFYQHDRLNLSNHGNDAQCSKVETVELDRKLRAVQANYINLATDMCSYLSCAKSIAKQRRDLDQRTANLENEMGQLGLTIAFPTVSCPIAEQKNSNAGTVPANEALIVINQKLADEAKDLKNLLSSKDTEIERLNRQLEENRRLQTEAALVGSPSRDSGHTGGEVLSFPLPPHDGRTDLEEEEGEEQLGLKNKRQKNSHSTSVGENKFQCEQCPSKTFKNARCLRQHKLLHEPKKFKCHHCYRLFRRVQDKTDHEANHFPKMIACTNCKCTKTFATHKALKEHERQNNCKNANDSQNQIPEDENSIQ